MINPAEEIVNVWLQDVKGHFTIANIHVPAPHRVVNGKKIHGGSGPEVDFLSTDGHGGHVWTEVHVAFNPYVGTIDEAMDSYVMEAVKKFDAFKLEYIKEHHGVRTFEKWYIYSPTMFPKRRPETEQEFCRLLAREGIQAISFRQVLLESVKKQTRQGYDAPRKWLYLFRFAADSRMKE